MYDFFMIVFTAMSGIGAVLAVVVTISVYFRQKKIALFERRMQILNDFERFVFDVLPDWEWNGRIDLITKYSEQEMTVLFNQEYSSLQKNIIKTAKSCNELIGDIEFAKKHGTCNNKTELEIEEVKINLQKELQVYFTEKRSLAYEKWLKI